VTAGDRTTCHGIVLHLGHSQARGKQGHQEIKHHWPNFCLFLLLTWTFRHQHATYPGNITLSLSAGLACPHCALLINAGHKSLGELPNNSIIERAVGDQTAISWAQRLIRRLPPQRHLLREPRMTTQRRCGTTELQVIA
jgi:hypothetical protein